MKITNEALLAQIKKRDTEDTVVRVNANAKEKEFLHEMHPYCKATKRRQNDDKAKTETPIKKDMM